MEIREILNSPTVVIIDLRLEADFEKDPVENAINIPFRLVPEKIEEIKKMSRPIVLCCGNQKESRAAHIYLAQHGLQNTFVGGSWLELNVLKNGRRD